MAKLKKKSPKKPKKEAKAQNQSVQTHHQQKVESNNKHPVATIFIESLKYLIVGGFLAFVITFFFPNAMQDIRHAGWFGLSNIEFDFIPLEKDNNFDPYENSVRQFTITNNYVHPLNPFLFIDGNYSLTNISIICTDSIGKPCENGFRIPAGEPTPMNLKFSMNNAKKGIYSLQFNIVAGKERESTSIDIVIE